MSGALRLFWIHGDSSIRSILGIRKFGLHTAFDKRFDDNIKNSCKPYKYSSRLCRFRNKSHRLYVKSL